MLTTGLQPEGEGQARTPWRGWCRSVQSRRHSTGQDFDTSQPVPSSVTGVPVAASEEALDPEEPLVLSGALFQTHSLVLAMDTQEVLWEHLFLPTPLPFPLCAVRTVCVPRLSLVTLSGLHPHPLVLLS